MTELAPPNRFQLHGEEIPPGDGFGKGGKTVAATLGKLGRRVVMVERSAKMYGGTCPNVGCVPSKALVHHSHKRRPQDVPQE
ncbi:FAD-dependent oxidoreductase [Streptomyces melanosporofaciens]|uniref:FAD-dependent oxidoreductase n=1 Tax=Streptomyces sp. CY1 TaxID=3388313 RepID=UPI0039A1E146